MATVDALEERRFLDTLLNGTIKIIDPSIRFWMIRTYKGFFYDEFITKSYIALGWNLITQETNLSGKSTEVIKEKLKTDYGEKVPMRAINKCKNFIHEVREGDIFLIPNRGTKKITLALAGEYYEEKEKSVEIEKDIIDKIKLGGSPLNQFDCPYKKRRKIKIIKTVNMGILDHSLQNAISNYHGISNFDTYNKKILDVLYDTYVYENELAIQVGVNTEDQIIAKDLLKLITGISGYMECIIGKDPLFIALNLNSPGRITFRSIIDKLKKDEGHLDKSISECLNEGANKDTSEEVNQGARKFFEKTKNSKIKWIVLLVIITGGGKFGAIELPGAVNTVQDLLSVKNNIRKEELEIERLELENYQKKLAILKELEEAGINSEELKKNIDLIVEANETLDLGTSKLNTKGQKERPDSTIETADLADQSND